MLTNLVIGYPLDHSLSPRLHNAIYKALHIDAELKAFANPSLSVAIDKIKSLPVGLTAVTMPFKEAIIPFLDEVSAEVSILQAANTVIQRNDKLIGYNTDVDGIAYALRAVPLENKKVLVIGAGGAAKAAGHHLKMQGAALFWGNRTVDRARQLAALFGGAVIEEKVLNDLDFDVLVNTTPLGMKAYLDISPLPGYPFKPQHIVFDMVYNPINTRLILDAKKAGATTISGLDMFISQGIRQIELWQGKTLLSKELMEMAGELYHE